MSQTIIDSLMKLWTQAYPVVSSEHLGDSWTSWPKFRRWHSEEDCSNHWWPFDWRSFSWYRDGICRGI